MAAGLTLDTGALIALERRVVDAVVMASAAQRDDRVYTSDVGDLRILQDAFPTVKIFGV